MKVELLSYSLNRRREVPDLKTKCVDTIIQQVLQKNIQIEDKSGLPDELCSLFLTEQNVKQILENNCLEIFLKIFPNENKIDSFTLTNSQISLKQLSELVKKFSNLNNIDFSHCNLTDEAIELLAKKCPNLTRINLEGCEQITHKGIKALALHCPKLTSIDYTDDNISLPNEVVQAFAQNCPRLTNIKLKDSDLTDETLKALAKRCSNLESIYLKNCKNITDDGIKLLAKHCCNLKNVRLSNCNVNCYDNLMYFFALKCPKFNSLNYNSLDQSNDKVKLHIKACLALFGIIANQIDLSETRQALQKIESDIMNNKDNIAARRFQHVISTVLEVYDKNHRYECACTKQQMQ